MTKRLLLKDLKAYRERQYKKQKGMCPICEEFIKPKDAVLDHCHKSSYVRKVLHRECNSCDGKLINALRRFIRDESKFTKIMENMLKYWKADYSKNPIHPKELSEAEKELKTLRKRVKKLKTKEGKDRHKPRIEELKEIIKKERENCWKE